MVSEDDWKKLAKELDKIYQRPDAGKFLCSQSIDPCSPGRMNTAAYTSKRKSFIGVVCRTLASHVLVMISSKNVSSRTFSRTRGMERAGIGGLSAGDFDTNGFGCK